MTGLFKRSPIKGEKDYYDNKKISESLKSLLFFVISFSLYFGGVAATGSNKNLLTFAAVLGLLPASRLLISAIMFFRFHGINDDLYDEIHEVCDIFIRAYGLVLTSYDKTYIIPVAVSADGYLYCLMEETKKNVGKKDAEEHIDTRLKAGGVNLKVGVFTDKALFIKRLNELKEKDVTCGNIEKEAIEIMKQISL